MPCHVSYDNEDKKLSCQFHSCSDVIQDISFDNKDWCWLHLPVKSPSGVSSLKENKNYSFDQFLLNLISSLVKNGAQEIDLSHVVFPQGFLISHLTNYLNKTIDSKNINVSFQHCQFLGEIFEQEKKYLNKLDFTEAEFMARTQFFYCEFSEVIFNKATFHEGSSFMCSIFLGCSFYKTIFIKNTSFLCASLFGSINFNREIIFNEAKFFGNANFTNTAFNIATNFEQAEFLSSATFSYEENIDNLKSKTFQEINFRKSNFSEIKFTNRKFLSKTNFSDCVFNKPPQFHGCALHQHTIFTMNQKLFRDTSNNEAVSAYRVLRLAMENLKARREEAMFYSLEQESLKNSKQMKFTDLLVSYCYKWFSNYGQSISRPLIWLLGTIVVACLLYGLFLTPSLHIHAPIDWSLIKKIIRNSSHISILEIIKPFTVDSSADYPFLQEVLNRYPTGARIIIIFQSLLSITYIALTLLAIRWKFKRD
jgi:uncharacterized protein YjbI with pentapeptide repeats